MSNARNLAGNAGSRRRKSFTLPTEPLYLQYSLKPLNSQPSVSIFRFLLLNLLRPELSETLPFLHPNQCTDVFCRFRNQRTSPESPSYHSQARTPPMNIKIEPSPQPSPPSDSVPASTEDQALLKRRNSSPQISQTKIPGTGDAKYQDHKPIPKKQRSSLSGPLSPKAECKIFPSKSRAPEPGPHKTEMVHKGAESKFAFDQVAPLLSAKAELKIVDELKARRDRVLRAIEQQCDNDCREGMKPCSIMLRLEIMHGGFAKSWLK